MNLPTDADLKQALVDAGSAHHDFEQVVLKGIRDEIWAGFYAAFVLGRLGDFTSASVLSQWLEAAPMEDNWAASASRYVLEQLQN